MRITDNESTVIPKDIDGMVLSYGIDIIHALDNDCMDLVHKLHDTIHAMLSKWLWEEQISLSAYAKYGIYIMSVSDPLWWVHDNQIIWEGEGKYKWQTH